MPGGLHPPVEVIIEWSKIGNPNHPRELRGWGLAIVCIVMFTLTITTVIARLWARLKVRNTAGIDDIIIVLAMIPTAGLAISVALGSRKFGFDRHAYDLTPALAVDSRKITMAIEATYIASTSLTKISILLFYRRMSNGAVTKMFRLLVWSSIAFVSAYLIVFFINVFVGCRPLDSFWNQVNIQWALSHTNGVDYYCINEPANLLVASAISIVQDFLACGLPTLLFWKLQLPRRQKIALAAIFGVGFFLCITGCLRIVYIYRLFYETYDVSWAAESAWLWTTVEAHLAIVCASAPALKVFFNQYFKVSSIAGSFSRTWRSRTYARKGYAGTVESGYGTRSTTFVDGNSATSKDVELGVINVTQVVDVDSTSLKSGDAEKASDRSIDNDERGMISPSRHGRANSAPWMYLHPSASQKRKT